MQMVLNVAEYSVYAQKQSVMQILSHVPHFQV